MTAPGGTGQHNVARYPLERRAPVAAFVVVLAVLSVPFVVLGQVSGIELAPGVPIAALAFLCPATAGAILAWRHGGWSDIRAFLARGFDLRRARRRWLVVAIGLGPLVTLAPAVLGDGPAALRPAGAQLVGAVVMALVWFVAALGEELGWTGWALAPLRRRRGRVVAGLLLGLVWVLWHAPAMVQLGQSPIWIAWGAVDMIATRLLLVLLYERAGSSVCVVTVAHASLNLAAHVLLPAGVTYDEQRWRTTSVLVVAAVVGLALALRHRRRAGRARRRE